MNRLALISAACGASLCAADPILVFGGELAISDSASGFVVDINNDGRFDLEFAYFGISVNSIFGWDGFIREEDPGSDVRFAGGLDDNKRSVHDRYEAGSEIGPAIDGGLSFGAIAYESFFDGTDGGAWLDQQPGFVGFSFLATDGDRHYGWAEVAIDNADDPGVGFLILTRIAYEAEPGAPIAAGDDGSVPGCNAADLSEPYGLLDLADVLAFATAFTGMENTADLDENGLWDLADVTAFIGAFTGGCP